jgi:hypothetical protein|tara:strand:+ start:994 stop:1293 length:300 start_codon:yes stop_codon:yes gene_type:complete
VLDKFGFWLDKNINLFYKNCPSRSVDENFAEEKKAYDKLMKAAELSVDKRFKKYLNRDKEKIKEMIGKKYNYNEKIVFVDKKVEKDILFFKNNYHDHKK